MTFEKLKKHATENGTQAGVLVSSLAAAMVERGDSDERLLNLVETAKEQGSQGGALLIELLDVMYDLGYDEDILDELWEGCSQQGNQSSAFMKETAETAETPPSIWPPREIGTTSITFVSGSNKETISGIKLFDAGSGIITKDFILNYIDATAIFNHSAISGTKVNGNYHTPKDGDNIVEHSTNYEWKIQEGTAYSSTVKVSAFLLNKKLVVLLHNKLSSTVTVKIFSVIEYNSVDVSNAIVEGTDNKEQSVTYIEM